MKLISMTYDENYNVVIKGRELHEFLQLGTEYAKWFERMKEYGFVEGVDFSSILTESTGGRPATDHALTLGMAKELSMIQRNERGKQARQYFIDIEVKWNSPVQVLSRALKISDAQTTVLKEDNAELREIIEEQRPKVLFAQSVETAQNSVLIGDLAKIIRQNGQELGQNRLFDWLRANNYLCKSGERYNTPTQMAMDMGLFEVKVRTITNRDGSMRTTRTTKVTGKGQIYFINKFIKRQELVLCH